MILSFLTLTLLLQIGQGNQCLCSYCCSGGAWEFLDHFLGTERGHLFHVSNWVSGSKIRQQYCQVLSFLQSSMLLSAIAIAHLLPWRLSFITSPNSEALWWSSSFRTCYSNSFELLFTNFIAIPGLRPFYCL